MNIRNLNITDTLNSAKKHVSESDLPGGTRDLMNLLILVIELLVAKFGANSKNSSKPPSQDPNRTKKKREASGKKVGGQKGHLGTTLIQTTEPDEIVVLEVDRNNLPAGLSFTPGNSIIRQVFDVVLDIKVTEYRGQVLIDQNGIKYSAVFPDGVNSPVQYGDSVKGLSLYLSTYQMLPYERIRDLFCHQIGLPISTGSLVNFNEEAANRLLAFEETAKKTLQSSAVLHHDETGVNVNGKTMWLHSASTCDWSLFSVHCKRGKEAMDAIGILPNYHGILVHDHWKPYFAYACDHAVCNAHLLRELERVIEDDKFVWASKMKAFLLEVQKECEEKGGILSPEQCSIRNQEYEAIITLGLEECPVIESPPNEKKKRGKQKKSKSRNLLERLRDYQKETLRFMEDSRVPFTNNLAERDIRMTKVQQKISGCFKSEETAKNFCRIRSFISTCIKQGFEVSSSLTGIFKNLTPEFKPPC